MRVSFLVTDDWFFWSHRLGLARRVRDAGCRVQVITSDGEHRERIEAEGFEFAPVRFHRSVGGQVHNLPLVRRLAGILRSFAPDVLHNVSFLPMTLGTTAARLAGVPLVVNAVTGLGHAFGDDGVPWALRKAVELGYRGAFAGERVRVLFQNDEDRELLVARGLVPLERTRVVRGSGVDCERFRPAPEPAGVPRVLFSGRMLESKGARVLVEAGRLLRERGVAHELVLVGEPHDDNPEAIPRATLAAWHAEGEAVWLGRRGDMPEVIASCHVVCLPTWYREGVPMALLEAAACGRPLVTTDRPGCRDIALAGRSGITVPARDPRALADALEPLLVDGALRRRLGAGARELVLETFSLDVVARRTLELYADGLASRRQAA